ncbi:GNAT family N-acetyltransferase [Gaoshiqia sp. Z1-71]|uniref:GNAT family N-acetyltransferase n=1 Tax=Gaoshiqia hydrogeniformans TaxID=3290090 RepID=UPI003BF862F7
MHIREAKPADNESLLRLTALTPMKGIIELRIERQPDFFALLRERGPFFMLVAENNGEIVGSIAVSTHQTLLVGRPSLVHYISDFKVHPDHQRTRLAFRLIKGLNEHLISVDADLLLCTTVLGNDPVEAFFDGRLGMPPFVEMATFRVFQFLPRPVKPAKNNLPVMPVADEELEQLADFYNACANNYTLAPFSKPDELAGKINLATKKNGQYTAALTLADYSWFKQNIIVNLPLSLNLLCRTSQLSSALLPAFRLPQKGEPIRLINMKRLAVLPGCLDGLNRLIAHARYLLYRDRFIFLTLALHPADKLQSIRQGLPGFSFYSKLWASSLKGNENLLKELKAGVIFEDYSLV